MANVGGAAPDAVRLDLPNDSIDFQITTSVFTHLLERDIVATLRELRRVMRPNGLCYNTWFLVDEAVLGAVAAGKADRQLPFERDGMFYRDANNILLCTAYRVERMQAIYDAAGHEITKILRGSWSGTGADNGVIYQDIVLSRPL